MGWFLLILYLPGINRFSDMKYTGTFLIEFEAEFVMNYLGLFSFQLVAQGSVSVYAQPMRDIVTL